MVTTRASADNRAARWRERNRRRLADEARARRERERQASFGLGAKCFCCGEKTIGFLVKRDAGVLCRNCDHMLRFYNYCSHHGVSRRLG